MKKWPLLPVPLYPQPGLIVAHPAATGSGHCGIVDYDGVGIAQAAVFLMACPLFQNVLRRTEKQGEQNVDATARRDGTNRLSAESQ